MNSKLVKIKNVRLNVEIKAKMDTIILSFGQVDQLTNTGDPRIRSSMVSTRLDLTPLLLTVVQTSPAVAAAAAAALIPR